ncbi:30S ribosomal protein S4e [[Eubacterium] cellulosolvens]
MSKHLKRLASPRSWAITRKTERWVIKPSPGPHPVHQAIPLQLALRDFLKLANTASEARRIIGKGDIYVDGKPQRNYKFPLGFMDVISIPKLKQHYRVLLDRRGKLTFVKISQDEAKWKLARIENKTNVSGGKTQLNLHDGRNILLTKNKYKTGDVLKLAIPEQKIQKSYPFEPGNIAMLIGGSHIGEFETITKYDKIRNPKPNIVFFEGFSTIKNYVFVVGSEKPEITIPDISVLETQSEKSTPAPETEVEKPVG